MKFSSLRARAAFTAFSIVTTVVVCVPSLHADDLDAPETVRQHCSIRGIVRQVDAANDRLTVVGDDDRIYSIDAYSAHVILADITRRAVAGDLERGMRVRASGTLVGNRMVTATTVRVVSDYVPPEPVANVLSITSPPVEEATLDGVVRLVDPDHSRITIADIDGARAVVDTLDAIITLPGRSAGQTGDLARGMHVLVAGTRLTEGRMVAERVRVLSVPTADVLPAPVPAPAVELPLPAPRFSDGMIPPSPDPQMVLANLDSYTGILIDARHLTYISRSPSPALFGPEPGESLLYPDRSHVPTPDQVQDESVVRYYHTEAEAKSGVAGDNPLILPAQAVLTPAQDSLQLSADDMVLFDALEKKLHYTRTWKVGFLIPGDK